MQTTYEDALWIARRTMGRSVLRVQDERDKQLKPAAAEDWRSVLAATAKHLRVLGYDVTGVAAPEVAAHKLGAVGRAIEIASDVLERQGDELPEVLGGDPTAVQAAQVEVAQIALAALDLAGSDPGINQFERKQLRAVATQLYPLTSQPARYIGLGTLGDLATGSRLNDGISRMSRWAGRWERASAVVPADFIGPPEMFALSAQLHFACEDSWRLVDGLLASPHTRLTKRHEATLFRLRTMLKRANAGVLTAANWWKEQISEPPEIGWTPPEITFSELRAAADEVMRPDGELLGAAELVPDRATADRLIQTVDELAFATRQVASRYDQTLWRSIGPGEEIDPDHDLEGMLVALPLPWHPDNITESESKLVASVIWSVDQLTSALELSHKLAIQRGDERSADDVRPQPTVTDPVDQQPEQPGPSL